MVVSSIRFWLLRNAFSTAPKLILIAVNALKLLAKITRSGILILANVSARQIFVFSLTSSGTKLNVLVGAKRNFAVTVLG